MVFTREPLIVGHMHAEGGGDYRLPVTLWRRGVYDPRAVLYEAPDGTCHAWLRIREEACTSLDGARQTRVGPWGWAEVAAPNPIALQAAIDQRLAGMRRHAESEVPA